MLADLIHRNNEPDKGGVGFDLPPINQIGLLLLIALLMPVFILIRFGEKMTGFRKSAYLATFFAVNFMILSPVNLNGQTEPPPAITERYYQSNYQNSTILITDAQGGQINNIDYRPFGKQNQATTVSSPDPSFTGHQYDPLSELYYFGSRYYMSDLGVFLSPDPQMQYHNPYVFASGDPLSGVDPDGEFFFIAALITAAIIGAYIGGSVANHTFNPV